MLRKLICFFKDHDIEVEYDLSVYARHIYIPMRGKCKRCGDNYFLWGGSGSARWHKDF